LPGHDVLLSGLCGATFPQRHIKMTAKSMGMKVKSNNVRPDTDYCRKKLMIDLMIEDLTLMSG